MTRRYESPEAFKQALEETRRATWTAPSGCHETPSPWMGSVSTSII
jgi:hypothetical protein